MALFDCILGFILVTLLGEDGLWKEFDIFISQIRQMFVKKGETSSVSEKVKNEEIRDFGSLEFGRRS